jgi:hypothetical protein
MKGRNAAPSCRRHCNGTSTQPSRVSGSDGLSWAATPSSFRSIQLFLSWSRATVRAVLLNAPRTAAVRPTQAYGAFRSFLWIAGDGE